MIAIEILSLILYFLLWDATNAKKTQEKTEDFFLDTLLRIVTDMRGAYAEN